MTSILLVILVVLAGLALSVGRDIMTAVLKWTIVGAIKGETHDRLAQRVRGAVALLPPAERQRYEEEWIAEMGAGLEKYGPRWAVKYTRGLSQAAQDISREEPATSRPGLPAVEVGARDVAVVAESARVVIRSVADVSLTIDALSGPRAASRSVADVSLTTDALSGPRAASRSVADVSLTTDALSGPRAASRSVADVSLTTDALSGPRAASRSVADVSLTTGA